MANLDKIVEELSKLTVLEAAELSKMLEESWGVSASAAAAPAAAGFIVIVSFCLQHLHVIFLSAMFFSFEVVLSTFLHFEVNLL